MPRRWLKLLDKWESYIVPETAGFQFDVILFAHSRIHIIAQWS